MVDLKTDDAVARAAIEAGENVQATTGARRGSKRVESDEATIVIPGARRVKTKGKVGIEEL